MPNLCWISINTLGGMRLLAYEEMPILPEKEADIVEEFQLLERIYYGMMLP